EVPQDTAPDVSRAVEDVSRALSREIAGSAVAERVRDGFEVAIVGRPNVGKSTLLNAIAGREAAITSEIAGTTRDVLEVHLDLGGLPVTLLDTAGLRESGGSIERVGMARARARAAEADLRVFLVDRAEHAPPLGVQPMAGDIVALAKGDLRAGPAGDVVISGKTGAGVQDLLERIGTQLAGRMTGSATAIRARHRQAMSRALDALGRAHDLLGKG